MTGFLPPSAYQRGPIALGLAVLYLPFPLLFCVGSAMEIEANGTADGSWFMGFAMLATMPFSLAVVLIYKQIQFARGVPGAAHDGGMWTLVVFALCALINAYLIWIALRGTRIHADDPYWSDGVR